MELFRVSMDEREKESSLGRGSRFEVTAAPFEILTLHAARIDE